MIKGIFFNKKKIKIEKKKVKMGCFVLVNLEFLLINFAYYAMISSLLGIRTL